MSSKVSVNKGPPIRILNIHRSLIISLHMASPPTFLLTPVASEFQTASFALAEPRGSIYTTQNHTGE